MDEPVKVAEGREVWYPIIEMVAVSYEPFADELIVITGITWSSPDQTFVNDTLRSAIERMVIDPLAGFGCLECEYRVKSRYGFKSKELVDIRLTPFGKGLLETL